MGSGGYLYLNKDAIIEDIKGKVMESVMPDLGGGLGEMIPSFTGDAAPAQAKPSIPTSPIPEGTGLGIPSF